MVGDVIAAILNFSRTFKKSPAHLHILAHVIEKLELFFTFYLSFCAHKKLKLIRSGHFKC